MSTDKTLADAQPGGRVRLGDQAERARFEAFLSENPLMALCAGTAWQVWQAALSAHPSPGGQGDADGRIDIGSDVVIDGRKAKVIGLDPYTSCLEIEWANAAGGKEYRPREQMSLAARQPVGQEPVGYLFTDDPAVYAMPGSGFHPGAEPPANAINVVPLYDAPPAQAVDLGQLKRFELFADEGPGLGGMSVDYEESDTGAWVRFDDLKALIDSRDSRNG